MNVNTAVVTTRTTRVDAELTEDEVHQAVVEYVLARCGQPIIQTLKRDVVVRIDERSMEATVTVVVNQELDRA